MCSESLGYRVVCEQVSHHPPVSAFHVDSPDYTFHGAIEPKLKFWGKSVEITPKGHVTLILHRYLLFIMFNVLSIFRPHCSTSWTRPVATGGVAWYVSRSVCCSVTTINPAKMAEPIKMLFGMWAQVSPRNHVLDGVQIP